MSDSRRIERWRWAQAAFCVGLTYATLGTARSLVDALRERNLLRLTVTALFVIAGIAVAASILRRRPSRREVLVLVAAASLYAILLPRLDQVEERLHFLQYGLIGALVYSALEHRWVLSGRRSDLAAGAVAAALVLAMGWIDEGIQYLLPSRYYDLRDVAFNLLAGALAISISIALHRARAAG